MTSPEKLRSDERSDALVPIDAVARRFGMRASTLRYYEERGLVEPASRHGGRRWYGPREIRRVAIIQFWQRSGLMSLDTIHDLLDGSPSGRHWQEIVQEHIDALRAQVEQLQRVQSFISQSLECTFHDCLDDCPDYEAVVWEELDRGYATDSGQARVALTKGRSASA
jgi:DNA-binding transcriptional MerR regulator